MIPEEPYAAKTEPRNSFCWVKFSGYDIPPHPLIHYSFHFTTRFTSQLHLKVYAMVKFDKLPIKDAQDESSIAESAMASDSEDLEATNSKAKQAEQQSHSEQQQKKRKRKKSDKVNGTKKRRHSVSKPARDPRDQASPLSSEADVVGTRSPSPVIDFDGLSKPSMCH